MQIYADSHPFCRSIFLLSQKQRIMTSENKVQRHFSKTALGARHKRKKHVPLLLHVFHDDSCVIPIPPCCSEHRGVVFFKYKTDKTKVAEESEESCVFILVFILIFRCVGCLVPSADTSSSLIMLAKTSFSDCATGTESDRRLSCEFPELQRVDIVLRTMKCQRNMMSGRNFQTFRMVQRDAPILRMLRIGSLISSSQYSRSSCFFWSSAPCTSMSKDLSAISRCTIRSSPLQSSQILLFSPSILLIISLFLSPSTSSINPSLINTQTLTQSPYSHAKPSVSSVTPVLSHGAALLSADCFEPEDEYKMLLSAWPEIADLGWFLEKERHSGILELSLPLSCADWLNPNYFRFAKGFGSVFGAGQTWWCDSKPWIGFLRFSFTISRWDWFCN